MVKKLQKMAAKKNNASNGAFGGALPAGLLEGNLAQGIRDSAQHIWAAGLGAFSKAQGEGGKVFEALVKEGLNLQKKTQSAAEEKLGAMANKVTGMAGDVGSKAGQHWDKLESIFEDRVARALNRLGVPSAKDVAELIERIDALSAAVGIKPPAKKNSKAAAKAVKPAAVVKKAVAKPAAKAKPEVKAAAKTAVKAKPAAKPATKPATKASVKPAAAPAASPFKKVASKTSAAVKSAAKPAAKAASKAVKKTSASVAAATTAASEAVTTAATQA
ncbi:phasin family protein [Roseateles sp.]|uniref:phasin family protein n=1 Tax=Roseateles sp. TaxID=1971397 RepID=UPI003BA80A5B